MVSKLCVHGNTHFLHGRLMAAPATWSTQGCPVAERVAYWREAACTEFLPLDTVPRDPARFFGHIHSHPAGPLYVSAIRSTAQVVQRGPAQITRAPGEHYFLIVQQAGTGLVVQQDRHAALFPGDAVLVDTRRPYTLMFDRDFAQLSISIPLQCLEPRRREHVPTGVRIANVGPLVSGYLDLFRDLDGQGHTAHALVNNVLELLDVLAARPETLEQRRDSRLARVQDYVRRYFPDPALGAQRAADANHLSVRLLHKLFAADGQSFGETLREVRLEHGRRRLLDAGCVLTILEISLESGYENFSCFTRAFKQRFGLTPSEYRAAATRRRAG